VLGHSLVEGECKDEWVGEGIRNGIGVEDGRNLGFTADAVHPFADVEYKVPSPAVDKLPG
jgi:hypothetical protein